MRKLPSFPRAPLALALAAALLPLSGTALAQTTTEDEVAETELDTVVVVGSRIKRAEIEGPAPITVITRDDIEKEGFTTVYEALNTLTQFTGSVQNELNQNGFTPNANFVNLRGLGPGYQLILINGRRAADYPLPYNSQSNAVNLGNIPAAAIERIEILTGSASAIYGSDAVAGVVNIVLKTNYEGDQLTIRTGTTTRGGGDVGDLQWVGGKTGERWSLTYAFELLEREGLFARQRDFMDSFYDQPATDRDDINPTEGLLLFDAFDSNRLAPDGREEVCSRFDEYEIYFFETSSVYTGPRCGYPGFPATQAIRNSDSNQSAYFSGTFELTDDIQGFAQLYHTRSEAKLASGAQFWASDIFFDPELVSEAIPFGAFVNTQRLFTPAETGGLDSLVTTIDERSYDFAAGLRGTFADNRFDWEATVSHSEYKIDSEQPRFLARALENYFLTPVTGEVDPYFEEYPVAILNQDRFFNPIDAATFRSLNTIVRDSAESSNNQASLVVTGDLFELPAGPVGIATVLEAADQEYSLSPDPRSLVTYTGPDTIYNYTNTGGGGDRTRYAAGVEFSVPIVDTLRANVAGRYDRYNDDSSIDGASTWQAGLEWRPFESLLIRGTHSTSFRAPDMHYIYAQESGFFTQIFDEYRCRRDGFNPTAADNPCSGADYNYQVFGTRAGDSGLEAEKGKSTTVGFVWDVLDNMSVSVDYYDIELRNAVGDISGLLFRNEADCLLGETRSGQAVDPNSSTCQFYVDLVQRSNDPVNGDEVVDEFRSFPINQSLNRTSGLDATWRYRFETDRAGEFQFQLAWTHVLDLEFQEFPDGEVEQIRDDPQYFNFRSRINGSVGWSKGDWAANVFATRWGSLPNWAETDRVAPHILYNINAAKKLTPNVTLGLYVNNVFDRIASRDDTYDVYPYFWRAYSPVGREVFAELDVTF
jgi:iron complex outermembrane receptor protein